MVDFGALHRHCVVVPGLVVVAETLLNRVLRSCAFCSELTQAVRLPCQSLRPCQQLSHSPYISNTTSTYTF